jgi:hypothetical protein
METVGRIVFYGLLVLFGTGLLFYLDVRDRRDG